MRGVTHLDAVLRELKRLQRTQRKSLGQLVSELVASALARTRMQGASLAAEPEPVWVTKTMAARFDLEDKDALHAALERE